MAKEKKPTLLLADEDCAWCDILNNRLKRQSDLLWQGCAASVQETLAIIAAHPPDLLGVEVRLSDGWGLALCDYCRQRQWPTFTLVLTGYDEDIYLAQALEGGAVGYLLKTSDNVEAITEAFQAAGRGERLWTEAQLQRVQAWRQAAGDKWAGLSEREREIVAALVDYQCDVEIADQLCLSPRTVNNHVAHILEKLALENRREVARWAVRYKLVQAGGQPGFWQKNE